MSRFQGFRDLVFDVIEDTTNLVERTHTSVWEKSVRRIGYVRPLHEPAQAVRAVAAVPTTAVYSAIRGVNRGVQSLTEAALDAVGDLEPIFEQDLATPMRSDAAGTAAWLLDHAQTAVNGFWGHHLGQRRNGLDLGMSVRHDGRVVPIERAALAALLPDASPKLAIFIHGLSCTEWCWTFQADRYYGDASLHFGPLLQADLGYTPLYVRYNTGRHVSDNGGLLSDLIEAIAREYPVPIEEVVLVGHSMGGLVARSAADQARRGGAAWVDRLTHVFCLGSPHLGAPLEKATNVLAGILRFFDTPGTQVPATLLNARSDGIKDLRFGYTSADEWRDRDADAVLEDNRLTIPLLPSVGYYFLAATVTERPDDPWGRLVGDVLVRLPSAAGFAREPERRIPFRSGRVFGGMNHFHLASHPDVYDVIQAFLQDTARTAERLPDDAR